MPLSYDWAVEVAARLDKLEKWREVFEMTVEDEREKAQLKAENLELAKTLHGIIARLKPSMWSEPLDREVKHALNLLTRYEGKL